MVEVVKGCTAQLECEVTGTAPFEVTWFKNKTQFPLTRSTVLFQRTQLHIWKSNLLKVQMLEIISAVFPMTLVKYLQKQWPN